MVVDTLGNILIILAPFVGAATLMVIYIAKRKAKKGQKLVAECEHWLRERTKK